MILTSSTCVAAGMLPVSPQNEGGGAPLPPPPPLEPVGLGEGEGLPVPLPEVKTWNSHSE